MAFSSAVFEKVGEFIANAGTYEDGALADAITYYVAVMNNSAVSLEEGLAEFVEEHKEK